MVLDESPPVHGCTYSFIYIIILPTQPAFRLCEYVSHFSCGHHFGSMPTTSHIFFCKYVFAFTYVIILPTPTAFTSPISGHPAVELDLILSLWDAWDAIFITLPTPTAFVQLSFSSALTSSHDSVTSHPSVAVNQLSITVKINRIRPDRTGSLEFLLRLTIPSDVFSQVGRYVV